MTHDLTLFDPNREDTMRIFDDLPTIQELSDLGFDFNMKFGIEFEFYSDLSRYDMASYIARNASVECSDESYNHRTRDYWKIVTDGSLAESDDDCTSYDCDDCDQDQTCDEDCAGNNDCPQFDCSNCRRPGEDRNDEDGSPCFEERDDNELCEEFCNPRYECEDCNVRPHCDEDCASHCNCHSGGDYGMELVSPPLRGYNGIQQMYRVLEAVNDAGVRVGRDCGLHIHHDASSLELPHFKRLAKLYLKYEPTIDLLMPRSRRVNGNCHCKSMRYHQGGNNMDMAAVWELIEGAYQLDDIWTDRYIKLNFTSYSQHGTIEFRHHSGTTDFGKTLHWLILTQRMMEVGKRTSQVIEMKPTSTEEPIALGDMARVLKLNPPLLEYWDLRAKWFADADERAIAEAAERERLREEYRRQQEAREAARRREYDICNDTDNAMPNPFRVTRSSGLPTAVRLTIAAEQLEARRAEWRHEADLRRARQWQSYARDFIANQVPSGYGNGWTVEGLDEAQPVRLSDLRIA